MRRPGLTAFAPLPAEVPRLVWPTGNRSLFRNPARYLARTAANPDYGRPGWTRDCGRRFHRGCDIAPAKQRATGAFTIVRFTDCATGQEYDSEQPVVMPEDDVFAVAAGTVAEAHLREDRSAFGRHVILRHAGPASDAAFFTLYAHLADLAVEAGEGVAAGQLLGRMGGTSASADARNWMSVSPHLHFEVWDAEGLAFDPLEFLRAGLRRGRPGRRDAEGKR